MSGGHTSVNGRRTSARRRADVWFALAALGGVAALAWVFITMQQLAGDLREANEARDALAGQVQELGEKPIAGPPGSRGESVVGPRGPRGPEGDRGGSGPSGKPGDTGRDGRAGGDGDDGRSGPAGGDGPPGDPGDDGSPGARGEPGQSGPRGEQGPAGERGERGPAGERGERGPAGSPPSSWTFTHGGVTYTCTPTSSGSTAYSCEPTGGEPDDDGLLSLGLDPSRRTYP